MNAFDVKKFLSYLFPDKVEVYLNMFRMIMKRRIN
jgi:hypothetical protein